MTRTVPGRLSASAWQSLVKFSHSHVPSPGSPLASRQQENELHASTSGSLLPTAPFGPTSAHQHDVEPSKHLHVYALEPLSVSPEVELTQPSMPQKTQPVQAPNASARAQVEYETRSKYRHTM